jgi:hypothetical protein
MKNQRKLKLNPSRCNAQRYHASYEVGGTDIDVLQEFTDNPMDAGAQNIQVTLDSVDNAYIIEDTSKDGMPTEIFEENYHTMHQDGGVRTGLGFFGMGSMIHKAVSIVRITIVKNKDGFLYSFWDTSPATFENPEYNWITDPNNLPTSIKKYSRPIKRFLQEEPGNGVMVILPKIHPEWGPNQKPASIYRAEVVQYFQDRYEYRLHMDPLLKEIPIRLRWKDRDGRDKQNVIKVVAKDIFRGYDSNKEKNRHNVMIRTWYSSHAPQKGIALYYHYVKVGTVPFMRTSTMKPGFARASSAESRNMHQAIFFDSKSYKLLQMAVIKNNYRIQKEWVLKTLANAFSKTLEENTVLTDEKEPKPSLEIPISIKNISPALYKAVLNGDTMFLKKYIIEISKTIPDNNGIPPLRKLSKAADAITNNNNGGV